MHTFPVLAVVSALAVTAVAAHEGHEHKVKGTVVAVKAEASQIEVKAQDGKVTVLTVDAATKYYRGSQAASIADVKVGSRVVCSARQEGEGKVWKALEIRLPAEEKEPSGSHDHGAQGHHH